MYIEYVGSVGIGGARYYHSGTSVQSRLVLNPELPTRLLRHLAFAFLWLLVTVGGVSGCRYLESASDKEKFDQAAELIQSGEYEKAEPILKAYKDKHPDEGATYWNLALVYMKTNRAEMAKHEVEELLRRYPNYEGAKELLAEVQETYELSQSGVQLLRVLTGHSDWIYATAFSPDGRRLISASGDKTVRLWDVETGKELKTFRGHTELVGSVAFSPDGKQAASGSGGMSEARKPAFEVKIWDLETGRELHSLPHPKGVGGVCFSPVGNYIASSDSETILVWEIPSGRQVHRISGHSKPVTLLRFSPDGRLLIKSAESRRALSG